MQNYWSPLLYAVLGVGVVIVVVLNRHRWKK